MTDVDMGPSLSGKALDRIDSIVKENVAQGAKLLLRGKRPEGKAFEKGNWYEPTILTNVKPDQASVQEEMFGPVLPIVKISGYEEVKVLLNKRDDSLSCYLYTQNHSLIM